MEDHIRYCTVDDLSDLLHIATQTYFETFYQLNTSATMQSYLEKAFNADRLRAELSNPDSLFYFLYTEGELAGYLKLNEHAAQTDINDPRSLEIERIYVKARYQGRGLGEKLMNQALDIGRERGKDYLWLGVWEKNQAGRAFYEKNGFVDDGTHTFIMGDEEQNDLIMRRDLSA